MLYSTNNIGPTSVGVNTFSTIVLLTLITNCNGGALLATQHTHFCLILCLILRASAGDGKVALRHAAFGAGKAVFGRGGGGYAVEGEKRQKKVSWPFERTSEDESNAPLCAKLDSRHLDFGGQKHREAGAYCKRTACQEVVCWIFLAVDSPPSHGR